MAGRRVAVIGGGIAGSLCGLVLRSRGFAPTIIDKGKRALGGRLGGGKEPDSGAVTEHHSNAGPTYLQAIRTWDPPICRLC